MSAPEIRSSDESLCQQCPTAEQPLYFEHDCPAERARIASDRLSSSTGWVLCSDRLPENPRSVLVWMPQCSHWSVASYLRPRSSSEGWQHDHESVRTKDQITHWMELPEGPK